MCTKLYNYFFTTVLIDFFYFLFHFSNRQKNFSSSPEWVKQMPVYEVFWKWVMGIEQFFTSWSTISILQRLVRSGQNDEADCCYK